MPESDHHLRLISSTPRMTRDEISNQPFPQAFRGLSEAAVRAFLRRVADDVEALRVRNSELTAELDDLRERASTRPTLDEDDLLTAVGDETARVLRSAKESADDIRRSAQERAEQLLHDAQEEVRTLREETEQTLADRTREADETSTQMIQEAERLARELRESAEAKLAELTAKAQAEAETELESARRRGKEIVAEAQAARDRILHELARRKDALEGQIDVLRSGRERLLDAYRAVKQSFEDATEALKSADVRGGGEARSRTSGPLPTVSEPEPEPHSQPETQPEPAADEGAAAEEEEEEEEVGGEDEAPAAEPVAESESTPTRVGSYTLGELPAEDETVEIGAEAETEPPETEPPDTEPEPTVDTGAEGAGESEVPAGETEPPEETPETETETETEAQPPSAHDVEVIFAKLRSTEETEDAEDTEDTEEIEAVGAESPESAPGADDMPGRQGAESMVVERRDRALDRHSPELVRLIKRVIRDEQNLVLEAIRQHRGVPAADDVLPGADDQHAAFTELTAEVFAAACADGEAAVHELGLGVASNGDHHEVVPGDRAGELAGLLATDLMDPLRSRLAEALEESAAADDADVAERVRARYREWKGQRVEQAARDALAAAFVRGLYDAVPDGSELRWLASAPSPCPDCADNALQAVARGTDFPTGHRLPPAHAGCHCLLLPVSVGQTADAQ